MNLWFEFIGVTGLAFLGLLTGAGISRINKKTGLAACLISVISIFLLAGLCRVPHCLDNHLLFALAAGRAKLIVLSFIVPLGLAAAMPYLLFRWEQWIVIVLIGLVIYAFGVFPFLGTAIAAGGFEGIPSQFDADGVCRQSTSFTCGPAAATTALRRLGITASESQLAILGRSCPVIGTTDYDLLESISTAGAGKIHCQYYPSNAELKLDENQVLLAILPQSSLVNHCVAVLDITDTAVVFADPAEGKVTLPIPRFQSLWSGKGILISR